MQRRSALGALAGIAMAGLVALPAPAETPEKPAGFGMRPITMIVPYGAGGGSDQLARAMADAMEKANGLSFQVVNKPGGGGTAAIPDFMLARADGYTVLEAIDDAVTAYAAGTIQLNPATDWWPVCLTQITFNQLYIRPDDTRFHDWAGFETYARSHPGEVTVANLGTVGAMEVVVMRQLEDATGLKFKQIAFDKPAERYASLIGGHVDALFEQPGDVRNFIDSGQIKPILTFLKQRPKAFADVAALDDIHADFDPLTRFRGFYVKVGTPKPVEDYLEKACHAAYETPQYQKFNKDGYMDLIDSWRDHDGAVKLIENAIQTYKAMYKKLGI